MENAINIQSEIGKLNGVILHTPGPEVEDMTPTNAGRALYSDILNLDITLKEYSQFAGVLSKVSKTHQAKDLLEDVLKNEEAKKFLLGNICRISKEENLCESLHDLEPAKLSKQLIEGTLLVKDNLTKYLSKEKYSLAPLHNLFFTRDTSIAINNKVLISKMASTVREREALLMETIFNFHPIFKTNTINPAFFPGVDPSKITIEGGDVLVARHDILLIGTGARTTTQGIDFILEKYKLNMRDMHILIQKLPSKPESFIHLDMVFTFLDVDKCMVYEPVVLQPNKYETVHIEVKNGKVMKIKNEENLLTGLKYLGMDLEPLYCGGRKDRWIQDREQWHSGANFFAFAPGKVIGYARNVNTIDELSNNGFEVLKAKDIIKGITHPDDYNKCVVTLEGSELPRGGGGARCMTMPFNREKVDW